MKEEGEKQTKKQNTIWGCIIGSEYFFSLTTGEEGKKKGLFSLPVSASVSTSQLTGYLLRKVVIYVAPS